jgi:hypothetical protein
MGAFLRWLSAAVVGVLLGVGSLYYLVFIANPVAIAANGAWRMNPLAGSASNDPYSRLELAFTSILALAKTEAIYFEARTDDAGEPLSSSCDYLVSGPAPDARWWSVTAYGPDDMLIPTQSARYSASAATAVRGGAGQVEIALTPDGSGPNGIATGAGPFILLLRLYQPAQSIADAPETTPLFRIEKGSCRA